MISTLSGVDLQYAASQHDIRQARRLTWAVSRRAFIKFWMWSPLRIIGLPALVGALVWQMYGWSLRLELLLITYVGLMAFVIVAQPFISVNRVAQRFLETRDRPMTVTITDEHVVLDRPGVLVSYHWSMVRTAEERSGYLFLRDHVDTNIVYVCEHCCGADRYAELRTFLVERGLLAAADKIKISRRVKP